MTENPKVNPEFKTICNKCFEPQNQCPCECYKECDMYPIIYTAYTAGIKKALEELDGDCTNTEHYAPTGLIPFYPRKKVNCIWCQKGLKKKLLGGC